MRWLEGHHKLHATWSRPRQEADDKSCSAEVYGVSGYCLCEGNVTVARMYCGAHRFRCRDKCAELAADSSIGLPLPAPLVCGPHDTYDMSALLPGWETSAAADAAGGPRRSLAAGAAAAAAADGGSSSDGGGGGRAGGEAGRGGVGGAVLYMQRRDAGQELAAAARVWDIVDDLAARHAPGAVKLPGGPRTHVVDWVREGKRMAPAAVDSLAATVAALIADLPPYPDAAAADAAAADGAAVANAATVADAAAAAGAAAAADAAKASAAATAAVAAAAGGAADYARIAAAVAVAAAAADSAAGGADTGGGDRDGVGGVRGGGGGGGATAAVFSGRGVVMVGGGLRYLVPAWVSIHVLRRTGCRLPVELWFPVSEFPPAPVEAALSRLGVSCRRLAARDLPQRGFGLKVAALLMSGFREVLFLDSDNAVLVDPTPLFDSGPYRATGALLWPDYWDPSAARELPRILNISADRLPTGTFESGQMVIDKARHWRGLLVAAYLNVYGDLFAELLTGYVGKGDKETFAYGMLAAGEALWVSPVRAGSAGLMGRVCRRRRRGGACRTQFLGNTMVQHGPDGGPLFFHANYHKWDLRLPASFEAGWHRRWQLMQPGRRPVAKALYENASSGVGYDVERYVYDVLRGLRCAPWFPALAAARSRMGEPPMPDLDGFHPIPDFTTLRDYYRAGWTGPVADLVHPPLGFSDRLAAWYFGGLRWRMRPWGRRLCRLRRRWLPRRLHCRH